MKELDEQGYSEYTVVRSFESELLYCFKREDAPR